MRNQKPLKSGTKLNMLNNEGVKLLFFVDEVIGTGGSCIVYQGHYFNSTGSKKSVRIKECYPFKLNIIRNEEGHLLVNDKEIDKFEEYKSCMKKAFGIAHRLHETSGMTNSTSDLIDIYEANSLFKIHCLSAQPSPVGHPP